MNCVPERQIDLTCVICYEIISTQSVIQNYGGKHSKVLETISRISFEVLRDLLNFDIQLFKEKTTTKTF